MPSGPLASVLLPCWNALDLTRVCLDQLLRRTTRPFELVIVLNGCSDGTRRWLARWRRGKDARSPHLSRLAVIVNERNLGYPAAMNQAFAAARGRFTVFANNDAAPGPFWLEEMTAQFARRASLGGLAPCANPARVEPLEPPWRVPGWYDGVDGMAAFAAACALRPGVKAFVPSRGFVPGFWFMAPRRVLTRVGGFDERFSPGGCEDFDLQARIRRAGFELGFAGRAYVHHVWFGAYRSNGRRGDEAYSANRKLLRAKHPETEDWTMTVLSPLSVSETRADRPGGGATPGSGARRPHAGRAR